MFRPSTQGAPFGSGGQRPHHGNQNTAWPYGRNVWGPNDWVHGRGSTRNPPTWAPEIEAQYPFRHWVTDVVTWCMSTDVDEQRKGPQIELALGGVARDLVREIPLQVKINGATVDLGDGNGPQQLTGAAFILHGLAQHYMPLEEESNLRSLADLHGFVRLPGETVDTVLTRFEVIVQRARTRARIPLQNTHAAWMLMLALRIPTEYWVHLLTPFRGALPTSDAEYRQFIEYVRRFGHLAEAGNYSIAQGVSQGHPTMWASPQDGPGDPLSGTQSAANMGSLGGVGGMFPTDDHMPMSAADDDSDTSDDEDGHYHVQDPDEPDMTGWTSNQVGEYYYQKYKQYKRKWRRFAGRNPKRQRGPTRRRHFFEMDVSVSETYFGKGKGGGKGAPHRKGNPIGRDGQVMRCSICNSDQHFRARCPQAAKGKGKGTPPSGGGTMHTNPVPSSPFTDGPLADFVSARAESHMVVAEASDPAATPADPPPATPNPADARANEPDPWTQGTDPWSQFVAQTQPHARPPAGIGSWRPSLRPPGSMPSGTQGTAQYAIPNASFHPQAGMPGFRPPAGMSGGTQSTAQHAMPNAMTPIAGVLTQMMAMPPRQGRRRQHQQQHDANPAHAIGFAQVLQQQQTSGTSQQMQQVPQLPDISQLQTSAPSGLPTTVNTSTVLTQFITNQFITLPSSAVQAPSAGQQQFTIATPRSDDPMDVTDSQFGTPRSETADTWAVVSSNAVEPTSTPSEHESRRDENETLCIICLSNEITHRLQPCLHSHFCETCAAVVIAGAVRVPPECPLCRVEVTGSEVIPQEMVIQQQPERQQASRDVSTYAFLLRLARRPAPVQSTDVPPSGVFPASGTQRTATQEETYPQPGTRTGLMSSLSMISQAASAQPRTMTNLFGPWWPNDEPEGHYLNKLVLEDGEVGLMPDTGAHDGLCGSAWALQQARLCRQAGKTVNQRLMQKPRSVQGVGNGSQTAQYEVQLTAGLQDSSGNLYEEQFTAPCLENSGVPGLMGIQSLERNDALIRCKTGEIWFLGRGGVKIEPSPGSRHFQMRKARSGHWLLPISKFSSKGAKSAGITLTTADATAPAVSTSSSSSS